MPRQSLLPGATCMLDKGRQQSSSVPLSLDARNGGPALCLGWLILPPGEIMERIQGKLRRIAYWDAWHVHHYLSPHPNSASLLAPDDSCLWNAGLDSLLQGGNGCRNLCRELSGCRGPLQPHPYQPFPDASNYASFSLIAMGWVFVSPLPPFICWSLIW